jgi:hypothetical protein
LIYTEKQYLNVLIYYRSLKMGGLDKSLMRGRLGVYYGTSSDIESNIEGVKHQDARLEAHGGDL